MGWIAWIFSEMWLTYALRATGWLFFHGVRLLGIVLSNTGNIMLVTFIIWAGLNLRRWLDKRQPRPLHDREDE